MIAVAHALAEDGLRGPPPTGDGGGEANDETATEVQPELASPIQDFDGPGHDLVRLDPSPHSLEQATKGVAVPEHVVGADISGFDHAHHALTWSIRRANQRMF